MTNEEAAAMLESMKNYFLPTSPMLEKRREITALDLAISALSKQCASSGQADQRGNNTEMVDQFREATKMTDFKPGDKFILELGQERKMFGEFEIKGTDLYVKTSLLEKLTRFEPEENATADKILIDLAEAIETVKFECGEWSGLAKTIVNELKKLSPKQSEKIPYKKPEIICDPDCEGFISHKNGIYGWCPKTERWGCEFFYELERRNYG